MNTAVKLEDKKIVTTKEWASFQLNRAIEKRDEGIKANLTALRHVTASIDADDKNPLALSLRANIQMALGYPDAALMDYDRVLELNPDYPTQDSHEQWMAAVYEPAKAFTSKQNENPLAMEW